MNAPTQNIKSILSRGARAEAAFFEASLEAIETARRTGTGVLVWRDGKSVELTCDEAQAQLAQHYAERIVQASSPPATENGSTS